MTRHAMPDITRILVPIDFSSNSRRALDYAHGLAGRERHRLDRHGHSRTRTHDARVAGQRRRAGRPYRAMSGSHGEGTARGAFVVICHDVVSRVES